MRTSRSKIKNVSQEEGGIRDKMGGEVLMGHRAHPLELANISVRGIEDVLGAFPRDNDDQ